MRNHSHTPRLIRPSQRFIVISALLTTAARGVQAQATANPITKAGDAFGFRNGDESIGIYNESAVRGFSLEAAGNYRLNGTYFVKSSGVSNFFLESRTVRIGFNTLNSTLPGPSGVVDYQLRDPARGEPGLYTVGVDEFSQPYAEALIRHRDVKDRYSMALGSGIVFRGADKQGGRGRSVLLAGTMRVRLGAHSRAQFFFGEYDYERSGAMFVTTADSVLPSAISRGQYRGQEWAQERGARRIAGLLTHRELGKHWSIGSTTVFSQEDPRRGYTQLFTLRDTLGGARSAVIASPHQQFTAWSGEVHAAWFAPSATLSQRATVLLRGRATRNQFGGDQLIDGGELVFGARGPALPVPDLSSTRATQRSAIDQWGLGVSYLATWRARTTLSVGALQTVYARSFADATGARTGTNSSPLLYNVGVRQRLTSGTEAYATHNRGLEDAGVAPSAASNRGTVLDAIAVTQTEAGVRQALASRVSLIVAGFSTAKPYAGLDATTRTYRIIGRVRHRGVEASLAGQPINGLSVVLGAVRLAPTLLLDRRAERGTRAVGVPPLRWIANGNWVLPGASGLSVDVGAEFTGATAAKPSRLSTTKAQPELPSALVTNIGFRARVALGAGHITVRGLVLNASDRAFWTVNSSELFDLAAQRRYRLVVTMER